MHTYISRSVHSPDAIFFFFNTKIDLKVTTHTLSIQSKFQGLFKTQMSCPFRAKNPSQGPQFGAQNRLPRKELPASVETVPRDSSGNLSYNPKRSLQAAKKLQDVFKILSK